MFFHDAYYNELISVKFNIATYHSLYTNYINGEQNNDTKYTICHILINVWQPLAIELSKYLAFKQLYYIKCLNWWVGWGRGGSTNLLTPSHKKPTYVKCFSCNGLFHQMGRSHAVQEYYLPGGD